MEDLNKSLGETENQMTRLQNKTREILNSCVMEEGMTSAVEFLSVECDMIFEPECDLESDDQSTGGGGENIAPPFTLHRPIINHSNYPSIYPNGESGSGGSVHTSSGDPGVPVSVYPNNARIPLVSSGNEDRVISTPNNFSRASVHHRPLIGELFCRRGVTVYKRSDKESPFVKIFHPDLAIPKDLKNGKLNQASKMQVQNKNGKFESDNHETKISKKERSLRLATKGIIFKCKKCRKQFASKTRLLTHRLLHSKRTGEAYVCPVCERDFVNKVSLKIHIQQKVCFKDVQNRFRDKKQPQNQGTDRENQNISPKGVQAKSITKELKNYVPQHTGNSITKSSKITHSYGNPSQSKPCSKPVKKKLPQGNCKWGQEKTSCLNTNKNSLAITKASEEPHTTVSHKIVHTNSPRCKNCKALLSSSNRHHAGDSSICKQCRISSKQKHKRSHRERKSYECPECGSQYRKSSALKKHRRQEHDVT